MSFTNNFFSFTLFLTLILVLYRVVSVVSTGFVSLMYKDFHSESTDKGYSYTLFVFLTVWTYIRISDSVYTVCSNSYPVSSVSVGTVCRSTKFTVVLNVYHCDVKSLYHSPLFQSTSFACSFLIVIYSPVRVQWKSFVLIFSIVFYVIETVDIFIVWNSL